MECLWTDPQDAPGRGPSKRGVGLGFGPDVTERWCKHAGITGLSLWLHSHHARRPQLLIDLSGSAVIRSHEVRDAGFSVDHAGRCITVFSAPNYVDQVGNKAAFVRIDDRGSLAFTSFVAQPHPNVKPMAYAGGFMGLSGLI